MTNEDEKLILEWCGFEVHFQQWFQGEVSNWIIKDGVVSLMPDIDLNFYFKYAVPKLDIKDIHFQLYDEDIGSWQCDLMYGEYCSTGIDPAEAFGQALLKLIKEVRND